MTDTTAAHSIRVTTYLGDRDDMMQINIVGPYPTRAARDADLARFATFGDAYGSFTFEPSMLTGGDWQCGPDAVAGVTSARGVYAVLHGWNDDEDGQA